MISLNLRCKQHPRYKGLRYPRFGIECGCLNIWLVVQWALGKEYPDSAREAVHRVDRRVLHSVLITHKPLKLVPPKGGEHV